MASDDEIVEMTLHSSESDLSIELMMEEREMHNHLDSKTGDPKPSSPLDLSQDGMAESTALTRCDEVPDTSEPDDDFVEVDQRVKEMVGDGKASLPSSSKEESNHKLSVTSRKLDIRKQTDTCFNLVQFYLVIFI